MSDSDSGEMRGGPSSDSEDTSRHGHGQDQGGYEQGTAAPAVATADMSGPVQTDDTSLHQSYGVYLLGNKNGPTPSPTPPAQTQAQAQAQTHTLGHAHAHGHHSPASRPRGRRPTKRPSVPPNPPMIAPKRKKSNEGQLQSTPAALPLVPDFSQLPEPVPYLSQPPEICRPYYPGAASLGKAGPVEFSYSMKYVTLSSIGNLHIWIQQTEALAKATGCQTELVTRFTTFPKPGTCEAFICQSRFMSCWHLLNETISGPVWAYMRVLGYSRVPVFKSPDGVQWQPSPVDAYYYAKEAGQRMLMPGSPNQSRHEVFRMVEEVLTAGTEDYPSERLYKKGYAWLKGILDNMIKEGDREVCKALYATRPNWAPFPDEDVAGDDDDFDQHAHHHSNHSVLDTNRPDAHAGPEARHNHDHDVQASIDAGAAAALRAVAQATRPDHDDSADPEVDMELHPYA